MKIEKFPARNKVHAPARTSTESTIISTDLMFRKFHLFDPIRLRQFNERPTVKVSERKSIQCVSGACVMELEFVVPLNDLPICSNPAAKGTAIKSKYFSTPTQS